MRVYDRDAGRHRHHRLECIAALGKDGATGLGGGGMWSTGNGPAMSSGMKFHGQRASKPQNREWKGRQQRDALAVYVVPALPVYAALRRFTPRDLATPAPLRLEFYAWASRPDRL
jgi:hypothetical protein